ncbi:MAG: VOC family protein [Hyphomicrobiales bacterium]|nr:VOC family protein [Hyphomicrobiales bacterium]
MAGDCRAIDHLVLPVTGLDRARAAFTRLGFTVAPDARHPFGTGNACIFFADGRYLEPLAVIDETACDEAEADGLFFVARARAFLAKAGEGFAMVALRSNDVHADRRAFEKAGFSSGQQFEFRRKAKTGDGGEIEIGVELAFASAPEADLVTAFACHRFGTESLFAPEFVAHENGVHGITGVVMTAENPTEHQYYLQAIADCRDPHASSLGIEARGAEGAYSIVSPRAFAMLFGETVPETDPLRLRAFSLGVKDPDHLRRVLDAAGVSHRRIGGRVIVPAAEALGTTIAFEPV